MLDEKRDVFESLAQPGNANGKDIQTIEQIASKLAVINHSRQVTAGSRDNASVHTRRDGAGHALEFTLLQNAQKLWLEFEWNVSDFVQEQGSPVRQFKSTRLARDRPSERATFVAEQ